MQDEQTRVLVIGHEAAGAGLRLLAVSIALASIERPKPTPEVFELKMQYKPEDFDIRDRIANMPKSQFIPSKDPQPWKRNRRK